MLKLGFRLSIGIHHRVFVIPWVKRLSAPRILCSEQRDYNSSGIIKYVPKKSRKISEDLISQSVNGSEKGIYASRLDHSVLGNSKEAQEGTFLDLQERNESGIYMNESCADFDQGIMSLEKGINDTRWDHKPKVKDNIKETGVGTFLDLQDKNDAGMYCECDASCDDSNEELEESSNEVRSRGYKSTRQHKQAYDKVKLHMEADQAKSSKEACKTGQEAENMAIRYLGLRFACNLSLCSFRLKCCRKVYFSSSSLLFCVCMISDHLFLQLRAELKKKLIGKKYPIEIVDRVINDFQIRGFINDSLYAESFSRSRWSSLSWGPRRIKQALFKKGISNEDSETAIKLVFEKGQCKEGDEEAESKHGMSKEAVDQLYVQASKRWLQGQHLPIETRKARVIRWLQYRGFNWGTVSQLVKRLESTHDS